MTNNLDRLAVDGNILDRVRLLEQEIEYLKRREIVADDLSEIAADLGEFRAGRLVAITAVDPTAIDAEGAFYDPEGIEFSDGELYYLGVMHEGLLAVGLRADALVYQGGASTMGLGGIGLNGLERALQMVATNGGATRYATMEMLLPEGGSTPVLGLTYSQGVGTELVTNGGFETGSLSGWTASAEVNGSWAVGTSKPHTGTYAAEFTVAANGTGSGTVTGGRIGVTASKEYRFGQWGAKLDQTLDKSNPMRMTVTAKWYDASSGGNLLRTDTLFSSPSVGEYSHNVTAPVGALSVEIAVSVSAPAATAGDKFWLDDVSCSLVQVAKRLMMTDQGPDTNDGIFPVNASWWFFEATPSGNIMSEYTSSGYIWGVMWGTSAADAANGNTFTLPPRLIKAGSYYRLRLRGFRLTDRGIIDIYADNVLIDTIDLNGASDTNYIWISDFFELTFSGLHTFKFVVNGTTGSDYRVLFNHIMVFS